MAQYMVYLRDILCTFEENVNSSVIGCNVLKRYTGYTLFTYLIILPYFFFFFGPFVLLVTERSLVKIINYIWDLSIYIWLTFENDL